MTICRYMNVLKHGGEYYNTPSRQMTIYMLLSRRRVANVELQFVFKKEKKIFVKIDKKLKN